MAMRVGIRGFTLTELLVVLAVLLVLMGILLPVLARSRAEARRTACKAQLSQLAKAANLYADEHGQRYPVLAVRPSIDPGASLSDTLLEYVRDRRVFQCPEDRRGLYEKEGASYEWNVILNGETPGTFVEQLVGASRTPMLYDYENFHPDPGAGGWGGKNVVFCDGSVAH
ncbi:MAG: prepilin-type N-terminal cleavage/methylation domain-containing protein [Planctomycetota bacterium]|nr:prepilin-type N-terminal cleavage/methylation domain-containing protein [Planctomycetota bacterium]